MARHSLAGFMPFRAERLLISFSQGICGIAWEMYRRDRYILAEQKFQVRRRSSSPAFPGPASDELNAAIIGAGTVRSAFKILSRWALSQFYDRVRKTSSGSLGYDVVINAVMWDVFAPILIYQED
jgi:hypothetical protein